METQLKLVPESSKLTPDRWVAEQLACIALERHERSVPKQCMLTVSLHCVGKKRIKKETKRKTKNQKHRQTAPSPRRLRGGSAEACGGPTRKARKKEKKKKRKRKKKSIDRWPWARGGCAEPPRRPAEAQRKFAQIF